MESNAKISQVKIKNSKDKGISVGENSKALINGSKISGNIIGIAIKDKSFAKIEKSEFINNKVQIAAYAKNWQYGGGGNAEIHNSKFQAKLNSFSTSVDPEDFNKDLDKTLLQNSKINFFKSEIIGKKKMIGEKSSVNFK